MKFSPTADYSVFAQEPLEAGTVRVWRSREMEDTLWDGFLEQSDLGQFQQSSFWARAKGEEGWTPIRFVMEIGDEIVGGFQILVRRRWFGQIGYISKGPIVYNGHPGLSEYTCRLLKACCRKEGMIGLVAQPPDLCKQLSASLPASGFQIDVISGVVDATWIVELQDGFEAVERRMDSETRRKARQAVSRGVTIREGGREDLQTFFELMLSTCRRQGVSPNPSNLGSILNLWDAAHPSGKIRLTFAEWEGKLLAGQVDICFGETVTQWKKGWNSTEAKRFPNDLLTYQALRWATSSGFRFFDFTAFDTSMALAILNGEPLTPEQEKSRYIFLARMGGGPRLLPKAHIYFENRVARIIYRIAFYNKIKKAKINSQMIDRVTKKTQSV
jgi:peptidoglycan pentaglycine glycine transferase (the first glycine)